MRRMGSNVDMVTTKTTGSLLLNFYNKHAAEWQGKYPDVKNPQALIKGIESLCMKLCYGKLPDAVAIYVIDKDMNPEEDFTKAEYVILVKSAKLVGNSNTGYSISLVYRPTGETESISSFEENNVVWSPDKPNNSHHPTRTKYYMGFTYMVCENSPGFELDPLPEVMLTGTDLIELGVEGEIPVELIKFGEGESAASPSEVQEEVVEEKEKSEEEIWASLFENDEEESQLSGSDQLHNEISNEQLNMAEDEYNDFAVDFDELFN